MSVHVSHQFLDQSGRPTNQQNDSYFVLPTNKHMSLGVCVCDHTKWLVLTVNAAQQDDISLDEFLNGPEWISERRETRRE